MPKNASATDLSLLSPRTMGGIHAATGFAVQERYTCARIAELLSDSSFTRLQPERDEDLDVWFEGGLVRDHHQIKNEALTPSRLKALVGGFRKRNEAEVQAGHVRWFVIAARELPGTAGSFAENLRSYRKRHFGPPDQAAKEATLKTLRSRAKSAGLSEHFDFIVEHVEFAEPFAGILDPEQNARRLLAMKLAETQGIQLLQEAEYVADRLMTAVHADCARAWSREELENLLKQARHEYRSGPAGVSPDLVVISHQTLKRVTKQPTVEDIPELALDRRIQLVEIDSTAALVEHTPKALSAVVANMTAGDGELRRAFALSPENPLVYCGFPHVPFGVLAGFIAQPQRPVAVLEHDLDSGNFRWRSSDNGGHLRTTVTRLSGSATARLRISVSFPVREEQCELVLSRSETGTDLHLEADEIGRGTVVTEAQARRYAAAIRRVLDAEVGGNPAIKELHVFAAVPVSVAFLLGQMLSHSALPTTFVYNFNFKDKPPYRWRVCLQAAIARQPSVHIFEERT